MAYGFVPSGETNELNSSPAYRISPDGRLFVRAPGGDNAPYVDAQYAIAMKATANGITVVAQPLLPGMPTVTNPKVSKESKPEDRDDKWIGPGGIFATKKRSTPKKVSTAPSPRDD